MTGRRFPKAQLSQRRASAALTSLLTGCTLDRLAGFTAEGLGASYNVPAATVKTMLEAARVRRG